MRWIAPLFLTIACGSGSGAAPKTAEAPESPPAAGETVAGDDAAEADEPETAEAPSDTDPGGDSGDAAGDENRERKILYRVIPGGLVVEIEGVKLEPVATPIQKKGGWGVRVDVKATSTDGKMHRLLSPENGPLAFSATVEKNGREVAHYGDSRQGDEEQFIPPDDSLDMSREFPGPKQSPLWGGQSLKLEVGLWGLGTEADRRRPVRKLFVVKMMTGNAKPQPAILPPD